MFKNASAGFVVALSLVGCTSRSSVKPGYQGIVELDERVISFEVPGRVASVNVRRGDTVAAGAVLATVDDQLERLQREERGAQVVVAQADATLIAAGARQEDVAALLAQVNAAKAAEEMLKKELDRARSLDRSGAITKAEVDRLESELDRASHERSAAQHRLGSLRQGARPEEIARAKARTAATEKAVSLEDEKLVRHAARSPARGAVLDVHIEVGELAMAGTPVATVADTTHPYVDVFVPQGSLDAIHVGTHAAIHIDARPSPFQGTVEWISPRTEFTPHFLFSERERPNIVVRVRVRVDDPESQIHAGIPAFVTITP